MTSYFKCAKLLLESMLTTKDGHEGINTCKRPQIMKFKVEFGSILET